MDALDSQLKEKESLKRITEFKLQQMRRSVKHNQLKPLLEKKEREAEFQRQETIKMNKLKRSPSIKYPKPKQRKPETFTLDTEAEKVDIMN